MVQLLLGHKAIVITSIYLFASSNLQINLLQAFNENAYRFIVSTILFLVFFFTIDQWLISKLVDFKKNRLCIAANEDNVANTTYNVPYSGIYIISTVIVLFIELYAFGFLTTV